MTSPMDVLMGKGPAQKTGTFVNQKENVSGFLSGKLIGVSGVKGAMTASSGTQYNPLNSKSLVAAPATTKSLVAPINTAVQSVVGQILSAQHAANAPAAPTSPAAPKSPVSKPVNGGGSTKSSNPGGGSSAGGSMDASSGTPSGGNVAPVSTDTTGSIDPILIIGAGALLVLFLKKRKGGGGLGIKL